MSHERKEKEVEKEDFMERCRYRYGKKRKTNQEKKGLKVGYRANYSGKIMVDG